MSTPPLHAREQFLDALRHGDAEQIGLVMADDFTFVDRESSAVVGRESLIALLRAGTLRFESIELVDDAADLIGESEVRFRTRARLTGKLGAIRYNGEYRLFEVYRRRGEIWQAVLSSAGMIP